MKKMLRKQSNLIKVRYKMKFKIPKFKNMHGGLKQALIIILIISIAALATLVMVKMRKSPERADTAAFAPLVKVQQLNKQDIQMVVTGYGTARAKVEVEIVPQVSGTVVSLNAQFKAGGFIHAGQEILKIDPRDYELAVRQAQASVADASVKLDMEKAEANVALDEWRHLNPGTEPDSPLVLRKPQIKQAKALLESASAGLASAKLALERTSIKLPIDVRIVRQTVDLGQFVTIGKSVGGAYGTNAIEIEIPLEDKELAWLNIPDERSNFNGKGSQVLVKADFAGTKHIWQGYVARTTGQVDKISRLVYVVVEVPDPFTSDCALLPGLFVEAQIQGTILKNVFAIPRDAIHRQKQGTVIWILNDNKLRITPLDIIRSDNDFAYVRLELENSDKIITSALDVTVDGMKVRIR